MTPVTSNMPPGSLHHFHFITLGHLFYNPEMGTCVRLEASGIMAKKSELNCALRSAGTCKSVDKTRNKHWVHVFHFSILQCVPCSSCLLVIMTLRDGPTEFDLFTMISASMMEPKHPQQNACFAQTWPHR